MCLLFQLSLPTLPHSHSGILASLMACLNYPQSQSPSHAPLTEPPTRSQRMTKSASHTLDTRAVSRSVSDANIKEKRAKAATLSASQRSKSESSPMQNLRKTDSYVHHQFSSDLRLCCLVWILSAWCLLPSITGTHYLHNSPAEQGDCHNLRDLSLIHNL